MTGEVKESGVVEAAAHDEEESAKDGDGKEIEDAVEDHLACNRQSVASLRQTPGDGVDEPDESENAGQRGEGLGRAKGAALRVAPVVNEVDEDELSQQTEDEVAPLVAGVGDGTAQPRDDPDLKETDSEEDGSPGQTADQEDSNENQGPSESPEDVADVEDRSSDRSVSTGGRSSALVVVAGVHVLRDRGVSEIRRHGKVGDETDESRDGEQVVEDTLATRSTSSRISHNAVVDALLVAMTSGRAGGRSPEAEAPEQPGEEAERVDCEDSPQPVGTINGEVAVGVGRVDVQGVVAPNFEEAGHLEEMDALV